MSERVDADRQWAGVGRGGPGDAFEAGRDAAAKATAGRTATLVVVFASVRLDPAAVLAGVASGAPGAQVVGCTTAGEISTEGPSDGTVVALTLGGEGLAVTTASAAPPSSTWPRSRASCTRWMGGFCTKRASSCATGSTAVRRSIV